jgi:O-antigen/teichoic acid export membrane protein
MESNAKNFALVLTSQGVSTLVSILRSLILPLFLTVAQFGYFQSYLLYITYVPLFCLGYNDGVYLRYGSKDYNELPFNLLSKSNGLFIITQVAFALIVFVLSYLFVKDSDIQFALNMAALYMIVLAVNVLIMQIYQITMNFKGYSVMNIIARVLSLVFIVSVLLLGILDYRYVVILDIVSLLVVTIYLVIKNKKLFIIQGNPFDNESFSEYSLCIKGGLPLMIANIMGMLILGAGQFALQFHGGIEQFAQYRFGVSISSFVLMAISSASLIIYPVLTRMDLDRQKAVYCEMSETLDLSVILIVIIYYAGLLLIKWFYPQYDGMLIYMGVLLGIVFFQAKIYILQNSYYKALRMEKELFVDNIISLAVVVLLLFSVFSFYKDAAVVAVLSLVAIVIRYLISAIRLEKKLHIRMSVMPVEIYYLIVFMIITMFAGFIPGLVVNLTLFVLYIFIRRYRIIQTINKYVKRNPS